MAICPGVIDTSGSVVDTGGKFAADVIDTGDNFATGVIDTGGAPWLVNIFANFRKNSKWPFVIFRGLGEKNLKQKILWHYIPLTWVLSPLCCKIQF